jgi:hypothetical protein
LNERENLIYKISLIFKKYGIECGEDIYQSSTVQEHIYDIVNDIWDLMENEKE